MRWTPQDAYLRTHFIIISFALLSKSFALSTLRTYPEGLTCCMAHHNAMAGAQCAMAGAQGQPRAHLAPGYALTVQMLTF